MSTSDSSAAPSEKASVKTLAIRLESALHAQLSLIAQLRGSTITEEIRTALETHIVSTKASSDLAAKADGVLDDIEREATARREAIATLFGTDSSATTTAAPTPKGTGSSRSRGSRSGKEASAS